MSPASPCIGRAADAVQWHTEAIEKAGAPGAAAYLLPLAFGSADRRDEAGKALQASCRDPRIHQQRHSGRVTGLSMDAHVHPCRGVTVRPADQVQARQWRVVTGRGIGSTFEVPVVR
jgi:hypothetical protein